MISAKIAELKNRLSYYLRFVRKGHSVLVYDRDRPIARIEPIRDTASVAGEDWTDELVRAGVLRPPIKRLPANWLAQRPKIKADVVAALLEERRSGR
ncbi:MAG: type II toxin-antitoxin system Phd/YefM family antitoxin [Gemmatimonadales bacterium]